MEHGPGAFGTCLCSSPWMIANILNIVLERYIMKKIWVITDSVKSEKKIRKETAPVRKEIFPYHIIGLHKTHD